jgi:hypothetical protein
VFSGTPPGEIDVMTGTGRATTESVLAEEVPPPGEGLTTVIAAFETAA